MASANLLAMMTNLGSGTDENALLRGMAAGQGMAAQRQDMQNNREDRARKNELLTAFPAAIKGDPNALEAVGRADPQAYLSLQEHQTKMQEMQRKQAEVRLQRFAGAALYGLDSIEKAPEADRPNAYADIVTRLSQMDPEAFHGLGGAPQQYDANWVKQAKNGLLPMAMGPEKMAEHLAKQGDDLTPDQKNAKSYATDPNFKKYMDRKNPDQPDPNDIEAMASGIANGQLPPLTGYGARSPRAAKIMARVMEINPGYRGTDYGSMAAAEKFWTSGKGGNTVRSINVAHAHLDTLDGLIDALGNGDVPLINKLSNEFKTQTGGTAPGNFDAAKRIVSDEIVKAIVGAGGALADREEAANSVKNAQTSEQLRGIINTYQELMQGQLDGLAQQYKSGTNRDDFTERFKLKPKKKGETPVPAAGGRPPLTDFQK